MEEPTSAHEQLALDFARRLAARIEELRVAQEVDELILVAPPRFLGQLRACLSDHAGALVTLSLSKDLSLASPDEIFERLSERNWGRGTR